jgi:hypothetical protein
MYNRALLHCAADRYSTARWLAVSRSCCGLAFFAGLLLDVFTMQVIGDRVDIAPRMVNTRLRCLASIMHG